MYLLSSPGDSEIKNYQTLPIAMWWCPKIIRCTNKNRDTIDRYKARLLVPTVGLNTVVPQAVDSV